MTHKVPVPVSKIQMMEVVLHPPYVCFFQLVLQSISSCLGVTTDDLATLH